MSKDILLRDINANFVNSRKYIEVMIKYVDPEFKFEEMEKKLIILHREFNLKREKHKNFLSWASKFHIPVNIQKF